MQSNSTVLSPWLISYRQQDASTAIRLFCFAYTGGTSGIFRHWAEHLPPEVEVIAVDLPGRGRRFSEPLYHQLPPLITELSHALFPYLDRPYLLFGHSLGALIAFELARQVQRQSLPLPLHLLVSGRGAPQLPDDDPALHILPEADFITSLRRYNGTPEAVLANAELMELMLPVLRADFALSETYHYQSGLPLRCPIDAYGGKNDTEVPLSHLQAWSEQTCCAFETQLFTGDHFFCHSQQSALLAAIGRLLPRPVAVGQ